MTFQTKFTAAISVDTWDAYFRWRMGDELRDRTIDATWRRVASAVAEVEESDAAKWEQRFVDAFRDWRMVPDARLLKWAGTGLADLRLDNPCATLNLGSFIAHQQASRACFDYQAFSNTAALAVRFLDDAWLTYGKGSSPPAICVGIMGFSDALAALGYAYVSERACEFASELGKTLSDACREASLRLARDRGPCREVAEANEAANRRGINASSQGVPRHSRTTAIHSQHLLALLANQACEALDPLPGSAWDLASRWEIQMRADVLDTQQILLQQIRLRGCIQPWIDAPIDYPLVYSGEALDPEVVWACKRSASQYHLPEPRFRKSERAILSFS